MLEKTVLFISQTTGTNINYAYRVFSEWLNMSDVGENFSNTKKPKISLVPDINNDQIRN